ncbi:MAG TPA: T9SS type A sorting domain-containing protein, partial [Rubricoccaceae bacterium]
TSCNVSHQYVRRTVERDTLIAGARYFVEVERRYTTASAPLGRSERLLRFCGATLVRRDGSADVPASCPLDADFDSDVACDLFGLTAYVFPQGSGPSVPGGFVQAGKAYETSSDSWEGYTAGVGLVGTQFWSSPFTLRYARVGGEVVFGSVIVADEPAATPAGALALRVAPNPTAGPLALALTLPEAQTVTVEAFDALGRRVWRHEAALGAGEQTLTVDASAWAPGVYVVRATAGGASAAARVVRR